MNNISDKKYEFDDSYLCNYFNKFKRTHFISELRYLSQKFCMESLLSKNKFFFICGRVFRKRVMGKSMFIDIKDVSGKIQIYVSKKIFCHNYKQLASYLNLGDIVGIKGNLFITKTKELSVNTYSLVVLSKNLNTFPDKRFGLLDKELCYRQRYLDLMVSDHTKQLFILRSKIISKVREFFIARDFLEVETPVMQLIPGGADAKPFETYHNYLNSKMFFRISPELYLKRLIVGGFERVFEIGKNFRNEGISTRHHPEFTTIEFYQAYSDYRDLMKLTEILFRFLVKSFFNKDSLCYNDILLNFADSFKRISFLDSIVEYGKFIQSDLMDKLFLLDVLKSSNIDVDDSLKISELQFKLFEHVVEKKLIQPTFVLHHPVSVSPLSRKLDENEDLVERFELYICGKEIANGFSELNDPKEQTLRFLEQLNKKGEYNNAIDKDFINALNFGLPPTAGEGIGLDRLVMIFTNSLSIKDVILFPIMKIK